MRRRYLNEGIDENTLFLAHFNEYFKDEVTGEYLELPDKKVILTQSDPKFGSGCMTGTASDVGGEGNFSCAYMKNNDIDYNITKEITIDLWAKSIKSQYNSSVRIGSKISNGMVSQLGLNINNKGYLMILNCRSSYTSWYNTDGLYRMPLDSLWHHIALVVINETCLLFLDGNKIYSTTRSIVDKSSNDKIAILCEQNDFIDEVRISNIARWTSNFQVPEIPY